MQLPKRIKKKEVNKDSTSWSPLLEISGTGVLCSCPLISHLNAMGEEGGFADRFDLELSPMGPGLIGEQEPVPGGRIEWEWKNRYGKAQSMVGFEFIGSLFGCFTNY